MVAAEKKKMAQGNKAPSIHGKRVSRQSKENSISRGISNKRGVTAAEARLTLLEEALVSYSTHDATPFASIIAMSNPGTVEVTAFPALQFWFDQYRTIETNPIAESLHLTQEVLFGSEIISSMSIEADARRECYALQEEVESRIIGLMPNLGSSTTVIFPIHDVDAQFTQMDQSGVFKLTVMYLLIWIVAKRGKP